MEKVAERMLAVNAKKYENFCLTHVASSVAPSIELYQEQAKNTQRKFQKIADHSCKLSTDSSMCNWSKHMRDSFQKSIDSFDSLTIVENRVKIVEKTCREFKELMTPLLKTKAMQFKDKLDPLKTGCYYNLAPVTIKKYRSKIETVLQEIEEEVYKQFKENMKCNREELNVVSGKVVGGYKKCVTNKETVEACSKDLVQVRTFTFHLILIYGLSFFIFSFLKTNKFHQVSKN